jgi:hypothetical protein
MITFWQFCGIVALIVIDAAFWVVAAYRRGYHDGRMGKATK